MIIKGFKLGMLLQFAIGPVCLFIFQTATKSGFINAFIGVLGVVLIDSFYIFCALLGLGKILKSASNKRIFFIKLCGAIILFVYGIDMILDYFNIHLFLVFASKNTLYVSNIFSKAMLLTLSNPLTIIFWSAIFSTEISNNTLKISELYLFSLGAILSSFFFLTILALCATLTQIFFPGYIIQLLNIMIGLLLIYFSFKTLFKSNYVG